MTETPTHRLLVAPLEERCGKCIGSAPADGLAQLPVAAEHRQVQRLRAAPLRRIHAESLALSGSRALPDDQACVSSQRMAIHKAKRTIRAPVVLIAEAAEVLAVSQVTLRRWDASGQFRARRHPINGYRLYDTRAVLRLREQILSGNRAA